jgi:hypothetical protein
MQAVKAFAADDKAAKVLTKTLNNLGLAFADPAVKKFISDLGEHAAHLMPSLSQQANQFARLIRRDAAADDERDPFSVHALLVIGGAALGNRAGTAGGD